MAARLRGRAMPDAAEDTLALLEEGGPRSDSAAAEAENRGCGAALHAGAAFIYLLLVMMPLGAVVSDVSGLRLIAEAGRMEWVGVNLFALIFAWRAITLYTATRPILSRAAIWALLVPGCAPELVARTLESRTTDASAGGCDDADLQLLYEATGQIPPKPKAPMPRRRSKRANSGASDGSEPTVNVTFAAHPNAPAPALAPSPGSSPPPSPPPRRPSDEAIDGIDDSIFEMNFDTPPASRQASPAAARPVVQQHSR